MTVSGISDIDREPYVVAGLTKRELKIFALFFLTGFMFLLAGVVLAVTNQNSITPTAIGLGTLSAGYLVAKTPPPSGGLKALRRRFLSPTTYVNGPVDILPKEFRYRGYRRDRRRVAELNAPFDGFDEAGRYTVARGVTRVLRVSPLDDDLLSEKERKGHTLRFTRILDSAAAKFSVHIVSVPINLETEITRLKGTLFPEAGRTLYAHDYAAYLATKAGERRQTFVPVHGPDAMTADLRADDLTDHLTRMGLIVDRLTPQESAALTALISGGQVPYKSYPSTPTVRGA